VAKKVNQILKRVNQNGKRVNQDFEVEKKGGDSSKLRGERLMKLIRLTIISQYFV